MKKVVRILSFAVLLLFLLIPIQVKAAEKQMYCLYNPANKEYLYTVDENERNNLLSVWEDKGVICS
nr:hypothetical protein [Lachnospiraceae bacterium]